MRKLIVLGAVVLLMLLALAAEATPAGPEGAEGQPFPGKRVIEVQGSAATFGTPPAGARDNHVRRLDHRGGSRRDLQNSPAGTVAPKLPTDSLVSGGWV